MGSRDVIGKHREPEATRVPKVSTSLLTTPPLPPPPPPPSLCLENSSCLLHAIDFQDEVSYFYSALEYTVDTKIISSVYAFVAAV